MTRPSLDDNAAAAAEQGSKTSATPVVMHSPEDDHGADSDFDPERLRIPAGLVGGGALVDDHGGDLVTAAETADLKRGLGERHLAMLGIAGAIGTGLFLSLGGAIQTGGPGGALLGYAMVGGVVCAVQFALGEVTALLPVSFAWNHGTACVVGHVVVDVLVSRLRGAL